MRTLLIALVLSAACSSSTDNPPPDPTPDTKAAPAPSDAAPVIDAVPLPRCKYGEIGGWCEDKTLCCWEDGFCRLPTLEVPSCVCNERGDFSNLCWDPNAPT